MNLGIRGNSLESGYPNLISLKLLILIFIMSLIIRVLFILILETWTNPHEAFFGYEIGKTAKGIAMGKGFVSPVDEKSPTAVYPPIFPLVMGGTFYIFGIFTKTSALALLLFQSVCASISSVFLAILGSRYSNRNAGLIAGFVWSFFPASIFFSIYHIWYSELEITLILLTIIIAVSARPTHIFRRIFVLGLLSGILILTDSALSIYPAFLLTWILISWRVRPLIFVTLVFIWVITTTGLVSPWLMRNWYVFDTVYFTKSNLGNELFTGNNPFSSGLNRHTEIKKSFRALDQDELNYYRNKSEILYNRYLQDKAIDWIRENPLSFLYLTIKRIWYFWIMNPKLGNVSWYRLVYFGPFIFLTVLFLIYNFRKLWHLAPVWLFFLIYPLPYYLTHVAHGRYFYPVEPLVILLGAITIANWFKFRSLTDKPV
jgi:hypothetical protein